MVATRNQSLGRVMNLLLHVLSSPLPLTPLPLQRNRKLQRLWRHLIPQWINNSVWTKWNDTNSDTEAVQLRGWGNRGERPTMEVLKRLVTGGGIDRKQTLKPPTG